MQVHFPIFVAQYDPHNGLPRIFVAQYAYMQIRGVWWCFSGSWSRSHMGELLLCLPPFSSTSSRTWWQGSASAAIALTRSKTLNDKWTNPSEKSSHSPVVRQGRESSPRCGDHPNQVKARWPDHLNQVKARWPYHPNQVKARWSAHLNQVRWDPTTWRCLVCGIFSELLQIRGLGRSGKLTYILSQELQHCKDCQEVKIWSQWPDLTWPGTLPPVPWRGWVRPCWTHCQIACHS